MPENIFEVLGADPSARTEPDPEEDNIFAQLTEQPMAQVVDQSLGAPPEPEPNAFAALAVAGAIAPAQDDFTPVRVRDVIDHMAQAGFQTAGADAEAITAGLPGKMERWAAKHPVLDRRQVMDVPRVAEPLRRYYAALSVAHAARSSPEDYAEGDNDRATLAGYETMFARGLLDGKTLGTLRRVDPRLLRTATTWLQTRGDWADMPEDVRGVASLVHQGLLEQARKTKIGVWSDIEAQTEIPGLVRELVRNVSGAADNLAFLRRAARAGVIQPDAIDRVPMHQLSSLDPELDPVTFAPHAVREIGKQLAPRVVATLDATAIQQLEAEAMIQADRATGNAPPGTLKEGVGRLLSPVAQAFSILKEDVIDPAVVGVVSAAAGRELSEDEVYGPFMERMNLFQAAVLEAVGQKESAQRIRELGRSAATLGERVALAEQEANWAGIWDKVVDNAGYRQVIERSLGPIGVALFDAVDMVVATPLVGVLPEGTGADLLNVAVEALPGLSKRGLARLGQTQALSPLLMAFQRNKATWRAVQTLGRELEHVSVEGKITMAKRVADAALDAGRRKAAEALGAIAAHKQRGLVGRVLHGGKLLQAEIDFAKARVLKKGAAVARALPDGWRQGLSALGSVDAASAIRAADPHGWIVGRVGRDLRGLPAEVIAEVHQRQAASLRATLEGRAPAEAADFGVPTAAHYAARFGDRALEVAVEGGTLGDIYRIAADFQGRHVGELRRRVDNAMRLVGPKAAQPLVDDWRAAQKALRALHQEHLDLLAFTRDAGEGGWRPGRGLLDVMDDEFAELVAGADARFGARLATVRTKALARAEKVAVRPVARQAAKVERHGARVAAEQARAQDLLSRVREAIEADRPPATAARKAPLKTGMRAAERAGELSVRVEAIQVALADAADELATAAAMRPGPGQARALAKAERDLMRLSDRMAATRGRQGQAITKAASARATAEEAMAAGAGARRALSQTERLERYARAEAVLSARLEDLKVQQTATQQALAEAKAAAPRLAATDPRYIKALQNEFRKTFRVPEMADDLARAFREGEDLMRTAAAGGGPGGFQVPLDAGRARRTWQAARAASDAVTQTLHTQAAAQARVRRLLAGVKDMEKRAPRLVEALEAVLKQRGVRPKVLLKRLDEVIAREMPELVSEATAARAWLEDFAETEVSLLTRLRDARVISDGMMEELLDYHRPAVYRTPVVPGEVPEGALPTGMAGELSRESGALSAQHVPEGWGPRMGDQTADWRVIYREGRGSRSRYFVSQQAADAFVSERKLTGAHVLEPVEAVRAKIKGLEESAVAARVKSLSRFLDLGRQVELQAVLQRASGLVIDEDTAARLPRTLREGAGAEFLHLPADAKLGLLAGKYVHKTVLTTLASWGRFNNFFRAMSDSMRVALGQAGLGPTAPVSLAVLDTLGLSNGVSRGAVNILRSAAMTSWIGLNLPAYVNNVVFNVAGAMLGLGLQPLTMFGKAFRKGIEKMRKGHPDFERMARAGLPIDFDTWRSGKGLAGKIGKELFGGKETKALRSLLDSVEAMDVTKLTPDQELLRLRQIDHLTQKLSANIPQRMARALEGAQEWIFQNYSAIDNIMKAGYANALLAKGLSHETVAQRIRDFMQNYSEVPPTVRMLSRSIGGSVITSFPYEWSRIMKNFMTRRPLQMTVAAAGITGVNQVGLAHDGQTLSQWISQMGENNSAIGLLRAATSLRAPGGPTLDLGNLMGTNMLTMPTGLLRRLGLEFQRRDGLLSALATGALAVTGRFLLNNPFIAGASILGGGRDPFTDRRLVDANAPLSEQLGAMATWALRTITPAWTPGTGGYQGEMLKRAWDQRAGRPIPMAERAAKWFGVKNFQPEHGMANIISEAARFTTSSGDYQVPLYGPLKDMYDVVGQLRYDMELDKDDKARLDAGMQEIADLKMQAVTRVVRGQEYEIQKSRADLERTYRKLAKDGPVGMFSNLALPGKALALRDMVREGFDKIRPAEFEQMVAVYLSGEDAVLPTSVVSQTMMAAAGRVPKPVQFGDGLKRSPEELRRALEVLGEADQTSPQMRMVQYYTLQAYQEAVSRQAARR